MSRIGKRPISVPDGVILNIGEDGTVDIKGPKGSLSHKVHDGIRVGLEGRQITLSPIRENKELKSLWGLNRTLLANMVVGVTTGFKKTLEIVGVGYKAELKHDTIHLSLGYSHPVMFELPEGIKTTIERQSIITLEGIDKYTVGETAARIRQLRKPDRYKGKGIRYQGERLKLKESKKATK